MATYQVGNREYEIPDEVQGEQLQGVLTQLASEEKASFDSFNQEEASFGDRLSRGVDVLQATGGRALQATGELFGAEGLAETGEEIALRNIEEADEVAPPAEGLFELIQESLPSLGAIAGGAGAGALAGAPFGPAGATIGALGGGLLTSFGLNVGDVKDIQETLNESLGQDSEFGLTQLGIASAATAPDLLFGGIATRPLKKAALEEAKTLAKDAGKKALAKKITKEIAKDVGVGAAAAGSSAAILLGGELAAEGGTDLLQDQVDALGETIAEAMQLGGLFSAGLGTGVRAKQFKELAEAEDVTAVRQDEQGEPEVKEPNPLAVSHIREFGKTAGDFVSSIAGKATDPLMRTHGDNQWVRRIVGDMVQRPEVRKERAQRAGKKDEFGETFDPSTLSNRAARIAADMKKEMGFNDITKLPQEERQRIRDLKAKGDLSDPAVAKLHKGFRFALKEGRKSGKSIGDLGDTYLPFFFDRSKVSSKGLLDPIKKRQFVDEAIQDMVARKKLNLKDTDKVESQRAKLERYVEDAFGDGAVRMGEEFRISDTLVNDMVEAYNGNQKARERLQRPITNKNEVKPVKSNLDIHRELSELSQEFLNKWSKNEDLVSTLENYVDLASTSIAAAEKFGVQGEKLSRNIRLAVAEGLQNGNPLRSGDVQRIVDSANVSQKLTTGDRSVREKTIWRNLRGISNAVNLQGAMLSSLLEPFFLLPKVGPVKTVTSLGQSLITQAEGAGRRAIPALRKLPKSERLELVEELGEGMSEAMNVAASKIGEDALGITTAEQAVFKYSGLAPWTSFVKQWGSFAAEDAIKDTARKLATEERPKVRARLEEKLFQAGLDPQRTVDWVVNEGGSRNADYFQNNVRDGIRNITRDVFILPESVDLPLWTSDPRLTILSNLKSFALAFNNTIGREWIRSLIKAGQNPRQAFVTSATISTAIPAFLMLDALKAASSGKLDEWTDKEPTEKIIGAVGRMGGLGLAIDPFVSASFGKGPLESFVSPVAPVLETPITASTDIFDVLTGEKDPEELVESVVKTLTKTTPFLGPVIREELE